MQVYGKDEITHNYNLYEAMEKTRQVGIKLDINKCVIKIKEEVKLDPAQRQGMYT